MQEISTFLAGIANVHLVPAARGVVVVDAGYPFPGMTRRILRHIKAAGYAPRDVRLILLTHGHVDHAGNAAALQRATGAPIALHRADGDMVERGWHPIPQGRYWFGRASERAMNLVPPLCRFEPFTPEVWLEEGQSLGEFGLEGYLIRTPGHTAGSVSLLLEEGEAIVGDALLNGARVSFPLYWENSADAVASARKLGKFPVRRLHTGHGMTFSGDDLQRFLEHLS